MGLGDTIDKLWGADVAVALAVAVPLEYVLLPLLLLLLIMLPLYEVWPFGFIGEDNGGSVSLGDAVALLAKSGQT